MRDRFLPFAPPDIGPDEIDEVSEALRSGWITTGPRTRRFEEEFAAYLGAPAAFATSSGTAALHLALLAHGVKPGHGVIVPTMTFSSAAHVVEHVGATTILVDVERDTLNIDPDLVEKAIGAAQVPVAAIAPVHLHGHPCDMSALIDIADRHDAAIVDDAAHAVPARTGDGFVGGTAHPRVLTAFSFYATKNLATGEGGMLTGPRDLVDEARPWALHGMSHDAWRRHEEGAAWRYDVDRAGFKYNLSDIQAAIGLVQLRRLPAMHARRTEIATRYTDGLSDVAEIELPTVRPDVEHAWHIYAIRLHLDRLRIGRDQFIAELHRSNIGTSVHFIPLHLFSHFRRMHRTAPPDLPVATTEFERLISLPIYPRMTDSDVDDVIGAVSDIASTHRR